MGGHRSALVLVALLGCGCQALIEGQYPLENINLSPGRGFSVRADLFCELTCGLTYLAWDPAHELAPWSRLGFTHTDPGELAWTLRVSPDERWAGLAERQQPYVILALHDFGTGFDWPACPGHEREACAIRALEGLAALQEPGGDAHILSTQAPGDLEARVLP